MRLDLKDRSNYLKGMLILAKKKKNVGTTSEISIRHIIKILDFNKEVINGSIKAIMINKYLTEDPLEFSNYNIAKSFLKNCIHIAFSDGSLNFNQVEWMVSAAKKNNLSKQWIFLEIEEYFQKYKLNPEMPFEIQKIVEVESLPSNQSEIEKITKCQNLLEII